MVNSITVKCSRVQLPCRLIGCESSVAALLKTVASLPRPRPPLSTSIAAAATRCLSPTSRSPYYMARGRNNHLDVLWSIYVCLYHWMWTATGRLADWLAGWRHHTSNRSLDDYLPLSICLSQQKVWFFDFNRNRTVFRSLATSFGLDHNNNSKEKPYRASFAMSVIGYRSTYPIIHTYQRYKGNVSLQMCVDAW